MSIYRSYGVEPIINACGSVTRLGGAPMRPAVLDAMQQATQDWVPLEQLQAAAARRLADATGTESALVTCGSAAALTLGAAAILTGDDLGRMERLPHCDGFPNELIIARDQRSGYDHAVRASGAKLVEVGFNEVVSGAGVRRSEVWEYEAAIRPSTAGVVYVYTPDSQPPLEEVVVMAHRRGLPVLVDAAGELPPRDNLKAIPATGADLVAFSGGKAIGGPQATGILCGRRDLVASAAVQMLDMDDHFELWDPPVQFIDKQKLRGIPRHGIGRGMKVSKEEIVALLSAVDLFTSGAYDAEIAKQRGYLETIAAALADSAVKCKVTATAGGSGPSILEIALDEVTSGCSALEACRRLRCCSPPIYVGHGQLAQGSITINPMCLREDHIPVLTARLREVLACGQG